MLGVLGFSPLGGKCVFHRSFVKDFGLPLQQEATGTHISSFLFALYTVGASAFDSEGSNEPQLLQQLELSTARIMFSKELLTAAGPLVLVMFFSPSMPSSYVTHALALCSDAVQQRFSMHAISAALSNSFVKTVIPRLLRLSLRHHLSEVLREPAFTSVAWILVLHPFVLEASIVPSADATSTFKFSVPPGRAAFRGMRPSFSAIEDPQARKSKGNGKMKRFFRKLFGKKPKPQQEASTAASPANVIEALSRCTAMVSASRASTRPSWSLTSDIEHCDLSHPGYATAASSSASLAEEKDASAAVPKVPLSTVILNIRKAHSHAAHHDGQSSITITAVEHTAAGNATKQEWPMAVEFQRHSVVVLGIAPKQNFYPSTLLREAHAVKELGPLLWQI